MNKERFIEQVRHSEYIIISLLKSKYMYRKQSQVSDLYAIVVATNQKEKVVFSNYYFCWWQQKFGSKSGKIKATQKSHASKNLRMQYIV